MSPIHLSNTAHAVLTTAVVKPDHAVALPERLPIAARRAVVKSMLTAGLLEEAPAVEQGQLPWRTSEKTASGSILRATEGRPRGGWPAQPGRGRADSAAGVSRGRRPRSCPTTAASGPTPKDGARKPPYAAASGRRVAAARCPGVAGPTVATLKLRRRDGNAPVMPSRP